MSSPSFQSRICSEGVQKALPSLRSTLRMEPFHLSRFIPSLPHIYDILFYLHLVHRNISCNRPTQQFAGPHVKASEVERTLDGTALQLPLREGGSLMTTRIAKGIEGPIHVRQNHAFPVHCHPRHLARGQVMNLSHRDKLIHMHLDRTTPQRLFKHSLDGERCGWG